MWRKRNASSSGKVVLSGRISSFRTSAERCDSTADPTEAGASSSDRAAVEDLALDRAALDDDALVAVERVEACLEQRVDRRRNDDLVPFAALAHHREHLLDVERVPLATWRRCAPASRRRARVGQEVLDQRSQSSSPSGSSRSEVALSFPPPQPGLCVEQLGPRDAEEEDRRAAREIGDVLDEVEERRLGPLEVVEHDDLRPLGAHALRGDGGTRAASRRPRCRAPSPGRRPIAIRISTSGQYVMPSP